MKGVGRQATAVAEEMLRSSSTRRSCGGLAFYTSARKATPFYRDAIDVVLTEMQHWRVVMKLPTGNAQNTGPRTDRGASRRVRCPESLSRARGATVFTCSARSSINLCLHGKRYTQGPSVATRMNKQCNCMDARAVMTCDIRMFLEILLCRTILHSSPHTVF